MNNPSHLSGTESTSKAESSPRRLRLVRVMSRSVKELLFHNMLLKLLSLTLAVVMWSMVAEDQYFEEKAEVFLDIHRPAHLLLINPPADTISIRVMAPRSKIKALRTARLELTVDLEDARPGKMTYKFVEKRIRNLPSGVEVRSYSPASLELVFEKKATVILPVVADLDGDPANGFVLARTEVSPARVTLEGPQRDLENLKEVRTEPIKLAGFSESQEIVQPLALQSRFVRVVDGREDIKVKIELREVIESRIFERIEVIIPETLGALTIKPATATVTLEGPKVNLREIEADDIRVFVEEGAMGTESGPVSRTLVYPPDEGGSGSLRLRIAWPNTDKIRLKKITPTVFELKLPRAGQGAEKSVGRVTTRNSK